MKPTKESFLRDIKDHVMSIRVDNGIDRRLHFGKPGTGISAFTIVTFPGVLIYTGDMGTYVFERLRDMFEFFRHDEINPGYWAEKVIGVDRNGALTTFSKAMFEEAVKEQIESYIEGRDEDWHDADRLRAEAKDYFSDCGAGSVGEAQQMANDFSFVETNKPRDIGPRIFEDFYERDIEDWSYRFIWACYAIVWAIKQYDATHATKETT